LCAKIALSFALAVDAALLLRSFIALTDAPLGFRTVGVLVAYANAPAQGSFFDKSGLDDHLRVGQRYEDLFARLREIPGVTSAAGAMGPPTGAYSSNGSYAVEGLHVFGGDYVSLPAAGFRLASPAYFRTMGIPVTRGREFGEGDTYDRPFVAVVSESLARQSFGAGDPLGRRIMCGFDSTEWMTIVGVVGDVRQDSPASSPAPELAGARRSSRPSGWVLSRSPFPCRRPGTLLGCARRFSFDRDRALGDERRHRAQHGQDRRGEGAHHSDRHGKLHHGARPLLDDDASAIAFVDDPLDLLKQLVSLDLERLPTRAHGVLLESLGPTRGSLS